MIPFDLATRLKSAGLTWKPSRGDRFAIPDCDLDDEYFVLSDMTIELHQLAEGPVIGFNGTTEWALDDVDQAEAVWLPREDQLRDLLGSAFARLDRAGDAYRVVTIVGGTAANFLADSAEEAYGQALLSLLGGAPGPRRLSDS
ncbi:MAG TPA: pilus assembly protein CpaE [Micromonosporaceae bacterium]|nr:pilus assembly protein CpaE [Micromonosporaceae bacterium]